MTDPKLSDFTEDQLRTILRLLMGRQMDIEKHISGLKKYPTLAAMLLEEIADYEAEIKGLDDIATQFAGAVAKKQGERIITSN